MNSEKKPTLYIIIPVYNEESVLPITLPLFLDELTGLKSKNKISDSSRILFVNDGSTDGTWDIVSKASAEHKEVRGISFSRNFGHQNALLAGLDEAADKCDITISVDCDGQDDIRAMGEMVDKYAAGADIVYGVRSDRKSDSLLKRFTAEAAYKIMKFMDVGAVFNHADYRLMSGKAVKELLRFDESNIFLRGLIPKIGFKTDTVYYSRQERFAGKTHYNISKMTALFIDGITSFSIKPIRLITFLGLLVAFFGFVLILWALYRYIIGETVAGWTSMTCVLLFLGGIQLISLGVIGEYIGKIYIETKNRPRYIIEKRTDEDKIDD